MLTSENGRFLLLLGLLTGSLSLHGDRSRLCSADLSSMPRPGQLLQPPHPSALSASRHYHGCPGLSYTSPNGQQIYTNAQVALELLGQAEQVQVPYEPQTQQEQQR